MNSKGLTLIELLVAIVIIGLIATFAVISLGDTITRSKIEADSHNLMTLNKVTYKYASTVDESSDIFDGFTEDESRINQLVKTGFIDRVITAQQDDAFFQWNVSDQKWVLIGGSLSATYFEVSHDSYDWSLQTIEDAQESGVVSSNIDKWSTNDGVLENETGQSNLFIPLTKESYTIIVTAALTEGTNGGYGIFFDTILRNGDPNRDDGYVFQFDRGYAEGAMIVRPRINGKEKAPVWTLKANQTNLFPSENEDPNWWIETHTIRIVVSNIDLSTRQAVFYIDNELYGTMEYSNKIEEGVQIYTGFRGWNNSPTKFHTISVN